MSVSVTWRDFLTAEDIRALADVRSIVSIALQSQYSHSEKYRRLGELFNEELDASPQLDSFYRFGLNPETATGVWLDWWGMRVGASRLIEIEGVQTRLDDDLYRFLIFYRAAVNIRGSTSAAINGLLTKLTGYPAFVSDYQDMTIRVTVKAKLSSVEASILKNYGLLNRPAGVLAKIVVIDPDARYLGFYGQDLTTFNQGVFYKPEEYD